MLTKLDAQISTSFPNTLSLWTASHIQFLPLQGKVSGGHVAKSPQAALATVDRFDLTSDPIRPLSPFAPFETWE